MLVTGTTEFTLELHVYWNMAELRLYAVPFYSSLPLYIK